MSLPHEKYVQDLRAQTSDRVRLSARLEALLVSASSPQDWEEFQADNAAAYQRRRQRLEEHARVQAALEGSPVRQFGLDLELALALALEGGSTALEAKVVRDVLQALATFIEAPQLSRPLHAYFQELLDILLSRMKPTLESPSPWDAHTVDAWARRQRLLDDYEQEYKKLKRIMTRTYRNTTARLLTLREEYPGTQYPQITADDLRTWRPNKCASIVHQLVGDRVGLTGASTRKYLQQARKERVLRASPPLRWLIGCILQTYTERR